MTQSKNPEPSPPRPEAAPLPFKRLTMAQRKAGEAIAAVLHRMAEDASPSSFVPAQEHAYLPHLEGRRSNRVLLIDGGRGTGKSTLMVTLLKVYSQQVQGQELKESFEKMSDRIIPTGIVDLQPLPPHTNLPLHIASQFMRVVDAVEPPGAVALENAQPLWEAPARSQLREKWQRLRQLLASWDETLEGRLGRTDMSAYVVETMEEETERGQLPMRFREAVDSLVEDYAKRYRWSSKRKPLFLLAIDDADMNPRLSIKLLELLRKLWHPRLAFLVAGDSELFLARLEDALRAQGEKAKHLKLAHDIYEKDIPSSARFPLKSLTSKERVKRVAEISTLLKQYRVEAHPPEIPHEYPDRPLNLRDYFLSNKQSAELFPDRLRRIDELTARLRRELVSEGSERTPSSVLRVVKWLWDQTVAEYVEEAPLKSQLRDMVRSSRLNGRLHLELQRIRLRSELEPTAIVPSPDGLNSVILKDLNRYQAVLVSDGTSPFFANEGRALDAEVTASWLLCLDVAADIVQGSRLNETASPLDEGSCHFVAASWREPNFDARLEVPWGIPAWQAPVDYVLFAQHWRTLLDSREPRMEQDLGLIARQYLWLTVQIARNRTVANPEAWWKNVPDWPELVDAIASLAEDPKQSQPRQQANSRWALEDAVLVAAPESSLPVEEARSFLNALVNRLGALLSEGEIHERRQARLSRAIPSSKRNIQLDDIDASAPAHPFLSALKNLNAPVRHATVQNEGGDLWNRIGRLPVPRLKQLLNIDGEVGHYSTDWRRRVLGGLPRTLYLAVTLEAERYQRLVERERVPLVLVGLWRVFTEKLAQREVFDWFSLYRDRIVVGNKVGAQGAGLRQALCGTRESESVDIPVDGKRALRIKQFASDWDAVPISLPPRMDALFRVVFDYVQDQDDNVPNPGNTPRLLMWPAISTRLGLTDGRQVHPWPTVHWQSLKEYEDLGSMWAETIKPLVEWSEVDRQEFKPYVADALAMNYLRNCEASRTRWTGAYYTAGDADAAMFADWLKKLMARPREQGSRRDALFAQWCESLPLMATPEAALSEPVAAVFIEQALSSGIKPEQLRKLRRDRARADGFSETETEAHLQEIDQLCSDHPWVISVEARGLGAPRKKP
jgi:hypothetical protein